MRPFDAADAGVAVDCYSGYKGDERPVRFRLAGAVFEIERILDRWYTPEGACFRVRAAGAECLLRHDWDLDTWTLERCHAHGRKHQP